LNDEEGKGENLRKTGIKLNI